MSPTYLGELRDGWQSDNAHEDGYATFDDEDPIHTVSPKAMESLIWLLTISKHRSPQCRPFWQSRTTGIR
jgi:hypothetical protein